MKSARRANISDLLEIPENKICADCKSKPSKWASTNIGVFICIDCSGIHRSLGTHISFVRSCTLDSWTDEQIKLMASVGNSKANDFWEFSLPKGFQRPSSFNRSEMALFIRKKYEQKEWAAKGKAPNEILFDEISISDDFFKAEKNTSQMIKTPNPAKPMEPIKSKSLSERLLSRNKTTEPKKKKKHHSKSMHSDPFIDEETFIAHPIQNVESNTALTEIDDFFDEIKNEPIRNKIVHENAFFDDNNNEDKAKVPIIIGAKIPRLNSSKIHPRLMKKIQEKNPPVISEKKHKRKHHSNKISTNCDF